VEPGYQEPSYLPKIVNMARDLLHADHHFDGQRRSWRRFNDKICDHLSGLICKQGMTCYGVISGEPQNNGGNANAVVVSRLWRREVADVPLDAAVTRVTFSVLL